MFENSTTSKASIKWASKINLNTFFYISLLPLLSLYITVQLKYLKFNILNNIVIFIIGNPLSNNNYYNLALINYSGF